MPVRARGEPLGSGWIARVDPAVHWATPLVPTGTGDRLAHVRAYGCEEYQGYYCSRPIPAEEFIARVLGQDAKCA